jgi:hypothetical protein
MIGCSIRGCTLVSKTFYGPWELRSRTIGTVSDHVRLWVGWILQLGHVFPASALVSFLNI